MRSIALLAWVPGLKNPSYDPLQTGSDIVIAFANRSGKLYNLMKAVTTFTFIFAVMTTAFIGCLMIFEIFTVAQGFECLLKALAAILLIGGSSALVTLATGDGGRG